MTQSLVSRDRSLARKKGLFALSAWAGAGILVFSHPIIALATAGLAGYLTYSWFMFRAKRGMRF
jgi:4-hydroxybenzoate polyprenyltransferase